MVWLAASFASAFLISGCNPSVAEQKAATSKQVARWKSYPKSKVGSSMGLVLEKEGKSVTAVLYDLKDGGGFVIDREVAVGKYLSGRKAFVLIPAGVPLLSSIEDWVAMNGMHFEVPLGKSATNLIATLKSPGLPALPTEFLRYQD
jgi:hypothetical protein